MDRNDYTFILRLGKLKDQYISARNNGEYKDITCHRIERKIDLLQNSTYKILEDLEDMELRALQKIIEE